jgi:hypothetical protein
MSPAYRAHPEFGYFCLSRRLRRRVLIALAVIGFGAFAGSQVLRSGHETADAGAAAIAPVRAAAADDEAIPAVKPATRAAETSAQLETTESGCEGKTWTYLDGRCSASRRKPHGVRGAVDVPPIAAIPLGRSGPPASASPATPKPERLADASATNQTSSRDAAPGGAAPPATTSPTRKVEPAPDPVATAPTSAAPTEQPTSASKEKKLRAGRSQNGGRDLEKGNSASRDERASRSGQRSARADASAGNRGSRRSSTGWAGQLRAGEHLLRAFLSAGI